ncbi:hypothetical protein JQT66_18335 [Sulfitobacter mediterraneus]|uniref:hypothetical protein n=1 Tax=Sulfitobacter mediterraneus TaxID=83219 RepID=UPI00193A0386|nr:hypothetical protein [Sulfitobacter mediterraneus]MBM1312216.1 hypothetical protein [Sulfitobacter mediterraneus]MBM1324457.1 hypothetical protein [Sulfitobacter mediterraneus]MBM1328315.1 hypothetical protein [Sulfitobacter mediterraneus]MBM1411310.1 hypothetical protein [Sulfitobacter mediterraneus]MBM1415211.1 hypothetical protein [Sulfitobacter mediterraneus]
MSRSATYLRFLMLSTIAALIFVLSPTDAAAHPSLSPDPVAEVNLDGPNGEAHCHGAIECVVTFYVQGTFEHPQADKPAAQHGTLACKNLAGVKLGRDPPIPIGL